MVTPKLTCWTCALEVALKNPHVAHEYLSGLPCWFDSWFGGLHTSRCLVVDKQYDCLLSPLKQTVRLGRNQETNKSNLTEIFAALNGMWSYYWCRQFCQFANGLLFPEIQLAKLDINFELRILSVLMWPFTSAGNWHSIARLNRGFKLPIQPSNGYNSIASPQRRLCCRRQCPW